MKRFVIQAALVAIGVLFSAQLIQAATGNSSIFDLVQPVQPATVYSRAHSVSPPIVAAKSAPSPSPATALPKASAQPLASAGTLSGSVLYGGVLANIATLLQSMNAYLAAAGASQMPPQYVAANGNPQAYGAGTRIDQLSNTTISNPTITGGSITAASIAGTIGNAINTALGTIDNLTSNTITATNVTVANSTTTNASISDLTATNATTSNLYTSGTSTLASLNLPNDNCSTYGNGGKLTTDAFGYVICAPDQGGSGSTVAGGNAQVQFNSGGSFDASANLTFNPLTNQLVVTNASTSAATTTNLYAAIATLANATSSSFAISGVPSSLLKTTAAGSVVPAVAGTDYVVSASGNWSGTFGTFAPSYYLDTRNLTNFATPFATGLAATTTTALAEGSNLYFTTARADARFVADLVATSSVASIGTLPNLSLPYSQLTGAPNLSNYLVLSAWYATTSAPQLNTGTATKLQNARTINGTAFDGSQNITITAASSSLLGNTNTWTAAQTFGTGATINGGLTLGTALSAGNGGTGVTNPSAAGLLLGSYAGGGWQQLATSSLGLLSTNVAEGSNLYFTSTRVASYINSSSTIPSVPGALGSVLLWNGTSWSAAATSSLGLAGGSAGTWGNITGSLTNQNDLQSALNGKLSLTNWYATTTDALAQGSTNKYFANALAQGAISVFGAPLTYSSGVVGINQSNASQPGYLSSADWTSFNGKLASTSISTIYPTLNVLNYGFVPDSTTDNSSKWTAVLSACAATNGCVIRLPSSPAGYGYAMGNVKILQYNVYIECDPNVIIVNNTTNSYALQFGDGSTTVAFGGVTGCYFGQKTGATPTVGNVGLSVDGMSFFWGKNLTVWKYPTPMYMGISINSLYDGFFDNILVENTASDGIDVTNGSNLWWTNSDVENPGGNGWTFKSTGGFYGTNLQSGAAGGYGWSFVTGPTGANTCALSTVNCNFFLDGVTADTATLADWNITALFQSSISNMWSGSNDPPGTQDATYISSSNVFDVTFDGLQTYAAAGDCLHIDNAGGMPQRLTFQRVILEACGESGTGYAVHVANAATSINVLGGSIGTGGLAPRSGAWSIGPLAVVAHSNITGDTSDTFTHPITTPTLGVGTSTLNFFAAAIAVGPGNSNALKLENNDFTNGVSGSGLLFQFGATSGNTYSAITPVTAGGTGSGNLILNQYSGNVGIGTTNPSTFTLQVAGSVGPNTSNSYNLGGSGNNWGCLYYNGGTLGTCASDARLKTNIQDFTFTDPVQKIVGLRPRTFAYTSAPSTTYDGLIAQEVQQVAPELVVTDASTSYEEVRYGDVQWLIIEAVQDIANIAGAFEQNLIAWLGNASNGIHDLYASIFHGQELCLTNSSGTQTCMNQQQLAAVLTLANQSASEPTSPPPSTSSATNAPPVIAISGANPAIVQVGASYTDLGATITGPQADLNLGFKTFLNGALAGNIVLDTTAAATDTIDYVVTDQNGLTSTTTRTVIVEAANDNQASSTPANDNAPATTTAATATP